MKKKGGNMSEMTEVTTMTINSSNQTNGIHPKTWIPSPDQVGSALVTGAIVSACSGVIVSGGQWLAGKAVKGFKSGREFLGKKFEERKEKKELLKLAQELTETAPEKQEA